MAKTKLNSALSGISGGIDNWVYRNIGGRTVISRRAENLTAPTVAQTEARVRFRQAAAYAKSVFDTPAERAFYEPIAKARGLSLFALCLGDFLKKPEVDSVDLSGYKGNSGDPIAVHATDDVSVAAVNIAIRAADLTVLEQGGAIQQGGVWVYHATTVQPGGTPLTVTATAVDRPGGTSAKTVTWI